MDKFIEIILGTIKAVSDALSERIAALEGKALVPGAAGPKGEQGERGDKGSDGRDGRDIDLSVLAEMKAEIVSARAEIAELKSMADTLRAPAKTFVVGKDVTLQPVMDEAAIVRIVTEQVKKVPAPKDGKDADLVAIRAMVLDEVSGAVGNLPKAVDGKDGASVSADDLRPLVADVVEMAVAAIPPAKDGKDGRDGAEVPLDQVRSMVASAVTEAVAALPAPNDGAPGAAGQSVDPADVQTMVERAVAAMPAAKDGVGVLGALLDREGHLVVTLSDGSVKTLGYVMGRDVDMVEVARLVNEAVDKIPRPKDGAPGRDGTLENLKTVYDGERAVTWQLKDGTPIDGGAIRIPTAIYRDVFVEGKTYEAGDMVTWGGSVWHAKETTTAKPGETGAASRAWQLAVKRGRDGKQGTEGKSGPQGPRGEKGDPGGYR